MSTVWCQDAELARGPLVAERLDDAAADESEPGRGRGRDRAQQRERGRRERELCVEPEIRFNLRFRSMAQLRKVSSLYL